MDDEPLVGQVECDDLQFDAAVVGSDPDEPASAISVAGIAIGMTVLMTCLAWARPIRCRRAGLVNRTTATNMIVSDNCV
ncbi:MAG: hypothetical protein AB7J32_24025 [Pseudonocardia sp.]